MAGLAILECDRGLAGRWDVLFAGRHARRQHRRELPLARRHRNGRAGARAGHVVGAYFQGNRRDELLRIGHLRRVRQDLYRADLDVHILAGTLLGDRIDRDHGAHQRRCIFAAASGQAADGQSRRGQNEKARLAAGGEKHANPPELSVTVG